MWGAQVVLFATGGERWDKLFERAEHLAINYCVHNDLMFCRDWTVPGGWRQVTGWGRKPERKKAAKGGTPTRPKKG
jgi:hypothetical protein